MQAGNITIWSVGALPVFVSHTAEVALSNKAQSRSVACIRQLHSDDAMPQVAESPEASFRAMLKSGGGYTSSPGVLASYVSNALPFGLNLPRRFESIVDEEVSSTVTNLSQNMLLTQVELGAVF